MEQKQDNVKVICILTGFNPWVRKIPWQRKWQPTLVLLPGKFQGQRSLGGYSPWGHKETDTTDHTRAHTHYIYIAEIQIHVDQK